MTTTILLFHWLAHNHQINRVSRWQALWLPVDQGRAYGRPVAYQAHRRRLQKTAGRSQPHPRPAPPFHLQRTHKAPANRKEFTVNPCDITTKVALPVSKIYI
jgi:hypothetical protein